MASLHPQIVHFAIALLVVGVGFRALSLLGRPAFAGPAAATLIALGTVATLAAAYSGDLAHEPVEAMPGLRPVVMEHEEWGERTRTVFLVVLLIEAAALALRRSPRVRQVQMASTVVGLVGLVCLFQAGEHGGEIVYGYAGGVGIRSGDPADVDRLLLAGLYQQGLADRAAGRPAEAAALFEQAARRYPQDVEVKLLAAESLLLDRREAGTALEALRAITPPENRAIRIRHGLLTADALVAAGQRDGAIAALQQLQTDVPSPRVERRLEELRAGAVR